LLFAAGCSGSVSAVSLSPAVSISRSSSDEVFAGWTEAEHAGRPASRTISVTRSFETHRIGAARDPLHGHRRARRVDVAFHDADLGNALRFLADAAGVQLVVDEAVGGATVSARLDHVDPLDAMILLAETHGAGVELRGPFAIVTAAAPPSAPE